jgi:hypothetical protein
VAKVKDRALQTATGFRIFYRLLRVFGCFSGLFQMFCKQDRLTDVRTDRRAPAKDLGKSSRSQGTTTNSGGGRMW